MATTAGMVKRVAPACMVAKCLTHTQTHTHTHSLSLSLSLSLTSTHTHTHTYTHMHILPTWWRRCWAIKPRDTHTHTPWPHMAPFPHPAQRVKARRGRRSSVSARMCSQWTVSEVRGNFARSSVSARMCSQWTVFSK